MNCRKVNHLLSAYMDGELGGVEHRQIRAHLQACQDCSSEYAALLQTKRLLAALRIQEPHGDLPSGILRRIEEVESARRHAGFARPFLTALIERLRTVVPASPAFAVGASVACAAVFLSAPLADPEPRYTPPGASVFVTQPVNLSWPGRGRAVPSREYWRNRRAGDNESVARGFEGIPERFLYPSSYSYPGLLPQDQRPELVSRHRVFDPTGP